MMTIPLEGYRDIVNPQQCPTKNAYFGFIEHFWDCGTTQPGWPIIHTITPIPPVTPPQKKTCIFTIWKSDRWKCGRGFAFTAPRWIRHRRLEISWCVKPVGRCIHGSYHGLIGSQPRDDTTAIYQISSRPSTCMHDICQRCLEMHRFTVSYIPLCYERRYFMSLACQISVMTKQCSFSIVAIYSAVWLFWCNMEVLFETKI